MADNGTSASGGEGRLTLSGRQKLGILLLPIVFAWQTLKPRYSRAARMFAFGWLAGFPSFRIHNGPVGLGQEQRFKSQGPAQRFLAVHGPIYNTFNLQPHLVRRPVLRQLRARAHQAWAVATAAA